MEKLNPIYRSLFLQLQIGEGTQFGLSIKNVRKFLKNNSDYTLDDFISTFNQTYGKEYVVKKNQDRVYLIGRIPKNGVCSGLKRLSAVSIVILTLIFILYVQSKQPITKDLIQKKIGQYCTKTAVNRAFTSLLNLGLIEEKKILNSSEKGFVISSVGEYIIPIDYLVEIFSDLCNDEEISRQLTSILPKEYVRTQQQKQVSLSNFLSGTSTEIENKSKDSED